MKPADHLELIERPMIELRRSAVEESMLLRVEAGWRPAPGWRERAACAGCPAGWWFNGKEAGPQLCRSCPVRMDCLAATLTTEETLPVQYIEGYAAIPAPSRRKWVRERRTAPLKLLAR